MQRSILVIEDNQDLSELLSVHLSDLGCHVTTAANGRAGLEKALQNSFDLIVLDLGLPEIEGLEICRAVKSAGKHSFIIMLTSRSSELDKVVGLELGADDYITKPFSFRELQARVKALFRRADNTAIASDAENQIIRRGNLTIDRAKRVVAINESIISLTAKEFDLLSYLAQHPGHVFSRTQLLDELWGAGYRGYEHTVNSHINRLRSKIEADVLRPNFVITVRGAGYKFADIGQAFHV